MAIAVAFAATACRAEANVILDIAEDGSGTYTVELGLDKELQDVLSEFTGGEGGLIPGFDFGALGLDENPLDSVPSRVVDDMTYFGDSSAFANLEELEQLIGGAAGDGNGFDTFEVILADEKVSITATAGAPGDVASDIDVPINLDFFEQAFSASVIVSMPGKVVANNADEVLGDGSLKWNISLTEGVDIRAESDLSDSSFPWGLVLVILLLMVALALSLFVVRRRSRISAAAVAMTPAPPEPTGFEPTSDDPFTS